MRIGIDATALYGRYGGVEYAIWNLLSALHAQGSDHTFVVYIPRDGPPDERLAAFGAAWQWKRLPFDGRQKLRRILWQQAQLPSCLREDRCDILHSPAYIGPLVTPVPLVVTVYDLIALRDPAFATRANRLHYGLVLPRSLARARRVIVPSERVFHEVAALQAGLEARTTVVPLGVEPIFRQEHDDDRRAQVRAAYNLPESFVLFVGNFEPKKNLSRLIVAMSKWPEAPPLVVAGGARAWNGYGLNAAQGCRGNADAFGASRRVLGYVPRRDLAVLYALCETFAFPSLAEGFGLPVLEALASGAAVVTSGRVPLANLASVAAIANPLDAIEIAAKLQATSAISMDPGRRAVRTELARQYAAPFTWQRAAAQTLAVYESAL